MESHLSLHCSVCFELKIKGPFGFSVWQPTLRDLAPSCKAGRRGACSSLPSPGNALRRPLLPFALPASAAAAAAAHDAGGSRHFLRTAVCVRQHRCRSLTPAAAPPCSCCVTRLRDATTTTQQRTDVVSVTALEQTGQSRVRPEYSASSLTLLCSAATRPLTRLDSQCRRRGSSDRPRPTDRPSDGGGQRD